MTIIGTFTKQEDGFNGTLRTLTLNVKVKLVPIDEHSDNAPDYRLYAGTMEIGAAWKRQTKTNKNYLSVKLDDPSFPAAINARLVDAEDGAMNLYWTRRADE